MYEELKKLAEELDGEEWLLVDGEGFEADNRFVTSQQRIDDNKVAFSEINYGHPDAGMGDPFQSQQVSAGKFIAAANPSAVLALIAERDQLFGITEQLKAENERLMEEISLDNKIIAERDRLLAVIPECGPHGQCVPHAIDWVERMKAENEELITALNEILHVTPMGVEAFGIAALVLGELGVPKGTDQ